MITVLGVDPGGTTGFCFVSISGSQLVAQTGGQLKPAHFVRAINMRVVGILPELAIACEAYMIGSNTLKKTRQHDPLELIGWLKYTALLEGWTFETQSPSSSKKLITNDMLKHVGLYTPGREHSNDAMRQALLWLARTHPAEFIKLQETCYSVEVERIMIKDD